VHARVEEQVQEQRDDVWLGGQRGRSRRGGQRHVDRLELCRGLGHGVCIDRSPPALGLAHAPRTEDRCGRLCAAGLHPAHRPCDRDEARSRLDAQALQRAQRGVVQGVLAHCAGGGQCRPHGVGAGGGGQHRGAAAGRGGCGCRSPLRRRLAPNQGLAACAILAGPAG